MVRYELLSFIEIQQNGVLLFLIFLFVDFYLYLFLVNLICEVWEDGEQVIISSRHCGTITI